MCGGINIVCRNVTVATFADNALYKAEAYEANLRAGKILNDHGVRVAYKSVWEPPTELYGHGIILI